MASEIFLSSTSFKILVTYHSTWLKFDHDRKSMQNTKERAFPFKFWLLFQIIGRELVPSYNFLPKHNPFDMSVRRKQIEQYFYSSSGTSMPNTLIRPPIVRKNFPLRETQAVVLLHTSCTFTKWPEEAFHRNSM